MADSPVDVTAWIVEKSSAWFDLPTGADGLPDIASIDTIDQMLANEML